MDAIRVALAAALALAALDGAAYARQAAMQPCSGPDAAADCWPTHITSLQAGFWGALATAVPLAAAAGLRARGRDFPLRRALAVFPLVALLPLGLWLLLFFRQPGGSCGPWGAYFAWPPCAHEYWILAPAAAVIGYGAWALAAAPPARASEPRETEA